MKMGGEMYNQALHGEPSQILTLVSWCSGAKNSLKAKLTNPQ